VITAFVGGRPGMISAATGAMALLMITLVRDHGLEYLFAATVLTGVLQVLFGVFRLSRYMKFVPRAVMVGFVNALAILIFIPLTLATLGIILPVALTLTLVGMIESLLTASIVDELTETTSEKNKEARGQGIDGVVRQARGARGRARPLTGRAVSTAACQGKSKSTVCSPHSPSSRLSSSTIVSPSDANSVARTRAVPHADSGTPPPASVSA
jgi:MFS superfamily sulfate permease-like transporter